MEVSARSKVKNRSYRAIKDAFFELLEQASFETVSIKDICECSGYSRGTFYSHFLDKYDMVSRLVEDEVSFIRKCWGRYAYGEEDGYNELSNKPYISQTVEDLFDHVYRNRSFYRLIAAGKIPDVTLDRMADQLASQSILDYQMRMREENQELNPELYFNYFSHMQFQHIRWWIDRDFALTPQYMARQFILIHYRDPGNLSFVSQKKPPVGE